MRFRKGDRVIAPHKECVGTVLGYDKYTEGWRVRVDWDDRLSARPEKESELDHWTDNHHAADTQDDLFFDTQW